MPKEAIPVDKVLQTPPVHHYVTHQSLLLAIGLGALLKLQYDTEGHMDEPVYELMMDTLHDLEQQYSNRILTGMWDVLPF